METCTLCHRKAQRVAALTTRIATFALVGSCSSIALGQVTQRNLVSDGFVKAEHTDPNLVNAWGLVPNPAAMGFWWVSDNHTGLSTLYDGEGNINSLVVEIPPPPRTKGIGSPTGIVFNGTDGFVVGDGVGNSGPARFIFCSEDGTISGWAPAVPPPPPSTHAMIAVDDSDEAAIYKGLALFLSDTDRLLYTTDFHNDRIEAYNDEFEDIELTGDFEDRDLPVGYSPFGIQVIGNSVWVTYALQDADAVDDVPGKGHGFVDEFGLDGVLIRRFASEGVLNSPWGVVMAPPNFGPLSGMLLIGNFGDGRINAFDPTTGDSLGPLSDLRGDPIEVEGLWGIHYGGANLAGPNNTLFFAAGPKDEEHGLFGRLDMDPAVLSDLNHDGGVGPEDLALLLGEWSGTASFADINGDGIVNAADLAILLGSWSPVP